MRRLVWLLLLCLSAIPSTVAVAAGDAPAPSRFRKGPYLQAVTSSSATVSFELDGLAWATVVVEREGRPAASAQSAKQRDHELVLQGLEPSTRYRYRVLLDSATDGEGGEFSTAPAGDEPFTFVVVGDTRGNHAAHRAVVDRIEQEAPDFVVSTGDLVNSALEPADWQAFFDIERSLLRDVPFFPTVGNHDRGGKNMTTYRKLFAVPNPGPQGEGYYTFDWGSARFVMLDSNTLTRADLTQTTWLEQTLSSARKDPKVKRLFVVLHHPPFSIATHGGDWAAKTLWAPLFEKYKVDVVFAGHDHVYQRLVRDSALYIVTGGGGAALYLRSNSQQAQDKKALVYFERVHHYVRVQVRGDVVELSAIRDDGSLIETVRVGGDGVTLSGGSRAPGTTPTSPRLAAARVANVRTANACATTTTHPSSSRKSLLIALGIALTAVVRRRYRRR